MSNDSISPYQGNRFDIHTIGQATDPEKTLKSHSIWTRDTITSQEKIDNEILNRLQTSPTGPPNDKLPIIARAGKYVFMATALPLYLFAYSIPRWIVVHLIPQTCQLFAQGLKQCFRPAEQLILILIVQFQKLTKIYKQLKKAVDKTLKHFQGFMGLLRMPFEKMNSLWKLFQQKVAEKKNLLQELLDTAKKGLQKKLKALKDAFRQRAMKIVYGRVSKDQPLPAWRQKLLALAKTIQKAYAYTRAIPTRIKQAIKKYLTQTYMTYAHPYVQKVRTAYQAVTTKIRETKEKISNYVAKQKEKVERFVKNSVETTKRLVTFAASTIANVLYLPNIIQTTRNIWQGTARISKKWQGKFQNIGTKIAQKTSNAKKALHNLFAKTGQILSKYVSEYFLSPIAAYLQRKLEKPKRIARAISKKLQKIRSGIVQKATAIKKINFKKPKSALYFKRLTAKAGRKARRAIYYTRLTASWTRILTGFWMVAVRNISDDLVEHFTWKDFFYLVQKIASSLGKLLHFAAKKTRISKLKTFNS